MSEEKTNTNTKLVEEFPRPPAYYKLFTTPDSILPPNIPELNEFDGEFSSSSSSSSSSLDILSLYYKQENFINKIYNDIYGKSFVNPDKGYGYIHPSDIINAIENNQSLSPLITKSLEDKDNNNDINYADGTEYLKAFRLTYLHLVRSLLPLVNLSNEQDKGYIRQVGAPNTGGVIIRDNIKVLFALTQQYRQHEARAKMRDELEKNLNDLEQIEQELERCIQESEEVLKNNNCI